MTDPAEVVREAADTLRDEEWVILAGKLRAAFDSILAERDELRELLRRCRELP